MKTFNCRSILCTPILLNAKHNLDYDGLLFDLEDSISINNKEEARRLLPNCIKATRENNTKTIYARVNSIRCRLGILDLMEILSSGIAPDIIILPKVETIEEIMCAYQMLIHDFPNTKIQVVIETAKGLSAIGYILNKVKFIHGLIFGAADFSADIGSDLNWDSLSLYRAELVKIGRINNLQVIDSPCFDYQNHERLKKEIILGYQLGFTGKVAIHPSQIPFINDGYLPTKEDINESHLIIEAANKQSTQIFKLNGRMIGPPIVKRAKRLIEKYQTYTVNKGSI